jgi:methionyl-tRNA synthetase
LKTGLEDISISRPKEKVDWGVTVPNDPNHVMYVWFEALLNYITVLGYPEHQDFKDYWPAQTQVIGKDILRFHAAIWPGILLALGIELPKQLFVHGFINVDGKKMSKSLGNSVLPQQIIDSLGSDAFRYYFLRHIPSYEDGDFSWEKITEAYNNELANELGNAVQRTAAMIIKYQKGMVGNTPEAGHDIAQYTAAIESFRFDKALDEVWEQVRGLNQYIDEQKPWEMAKENDFGHLQEVLAYMVACLIEIADLLEPFLPTTTANIRHIVGKGVIQPMETTMFPKKELAS